MPAKFPISKGVHLNKAIVIGFVIALCIIAITLVRNQPSGFSKINNILSIHTIYLNGFGINVRIARTDEEKLRGLNDLDSMPRNAGMIYVFDRDGIYDISTTYMRFPIDVIWIDQYGIVVDVRNNVAPGLPYPVRNQILARYVLIVNAGVAGNNDIVPQTRIALPGI